MFGGPFGYRRRIYRPRYYRSGCGCGSLLSSILLSLGLTFLANMILRRR